jgi:hypothetical protein
MIKIKREKKPEHEARVGAVRNAYIILVGKIRRQETTCKA